jgi:hypothetical protein
MLRAHRRFPLTDHSLRRRAAAMYAAREKYAPALCSGAQ